MRKRSVPEGHLERSVHSLQGVNVYLVEEVEVLAGLEAYGFAGDDADFGAGAGVAADAGFSRPYVEDSETAQLDALAVRQGALHAFEDGFDSHFGLGFSDSCFVYDFVDDVELDQGRPPAEFVTN